MRPRLPLRYKPFTSVIALKRETWESNIALATSRPRQSRWLSLIILGQNRPCWLLCLRKLNTRTTFCTCFHPSLLKNLKYKHMSISVEGCDILLFPRNDLLPQLQRAAFGLTLWFCLFLFRSSSWNLSSHGCTAAVGQPTSLQNSR